MEEVELEEEVDVEKYEQLVEVKAVAKVEESCMWWR